jgi:hypothetical protein
MYEKTTVFSSTLKPKKEAGFSADNRPVSGTLFFSTPDLIQ